MGSSRNRPISESAQRWAASAVDPLARVVRVRRLVGGISSAVHQLTIQSPIGSRHELVLRRWVGVADSNMLADRVRREAHVLAALSRYGSVPSPELIAIDPTGTETGGEPALLMTHLTGRVDLAPADPDAWLKQMAAVLPRIHGAPVSAPPFENWFDPEALVVPKWSSQPDAWGTAIRLVREGLPPGGIVFLHGDFQHFNLLWLRGQLSGVVDWEKASIGSPDVDVAHCRLNLAVLFSADRAEQFRLRYEAEAGRSTDPRYDLASLIGYDQEWKQFIPVQVGSRLPVDAHGMDARIDDLLLRVLARC